MPEALGEKRREWGEEMDYSGLDDEEALPDLPDRFEPEVDINGIKTITSYSDQLDASTGEPTGKKIKTARHSPRQPAAVRTM